MKRLVDLKDPCRDWWRAEREGEGCSEQRQRETAKESCTGEHLESEREIDRKEKKKVSEEVEMRRRRRLTEADDCV